MSKLNISSNGCILYLKPKSLVDNQTDTLQYAYRLFVRDIFPPVCHCCLSVSSAQWQGRGEILGEVWKAACCIDCAWAENLFGSMVEVIKQRHRQDVACVRPSICSTLTCCCGCKVGRIEAYSMMYVDVKIKMLFWVLFLNQFTAG